MRTAALALVSACALAACNPSAPGAPAGGVFPNLNASAYRLEANITSERGAMPVVMIRDGQKSRIEMSTPQGNQVIISNGETGETISLVNFGGQQRALRMTSDQVDNPAEQWQAELASTATITGACAGAGETGSQWTNQQQDHTDVVCVTSDGIILSAARDGQQTWETTSVQRGPQSAELFTLPPGVEVTDMGQMNAQMQEAIERAKAAAGQ
jgi:hypothetical protein